MECGDPRYGDLLRRMELRSETYRWPLCRPVLRFRQCPQSNNSNTLYASLPDQCSLKQFACYEESDEPLATDQSIIFDFPPKFAQMNQQLGDLNQPESPGTEHKSAYICFKKGLAEHLVAHRPPTCHSGW